MFTLQTVQYIYIVHWRCSTMQNPHVWPPTFYPDSPSTMIGRLMMNITVIGLFPLCFLVEYESWSCPSFLLIVSSVLNIGNYNMIVVTSCHLPHDKVWTCYCSVLKVLTIVMLELRTTTNNGNFFSFQNNTNFKTILLVRIVSKLFSKLSSWG